MTTPYVGEIRLLPYSFAPAGWLDCDGSLQSISNYQLLYTLLGTLYGGDGQTTFGLPDLRGRVPLHMGTGQGLTPRTLGELGGTETVTLTPGQMPAHSHPYAATSATAGSSTPGPGVQLGAVSSDPVYTGDITGLGSADLAASMIAASGGSQPHDNTMPTLTVRFCIATDGVFPSQV